MKRILAEPLLHFLVLAAVLFGAYGLVAKRSGGEPGSIVITQGQVAAIVESFVRTRQRPPTDEELDGLLRDRVRDEVYAREAIALGLDKDDTVIRRRLRQKMEFVSEDVAAEVEPTDADLAAYLAGHADAFRVEPRLTFRQVYLNPEKHGERLARDAARLLARLRELGDADEASTVGDASLLGDRFADVPAREVAAQFGDEFAAKLGELPTGRWQGPVPSGYGTHLVLVGARTESRVPALAEVRDAVRREWANARRLEANERFFQELLQRYTVTVERAGTPEASTLATTR